MLTKCIKLTIYPVDNKLTKNEIYKEMHDISYKTRRACNYAMNLQYKELMRKVEEKELQEKIGKYMDYLLVHGLIGKW